MALQATIVFQANWGAVKATNADGSRKYRYIVNRGSSRSSKTISIIDLYDLYAREQSNKRLTVWRDTKTDCKKTVLVDFIRRLRTTNRYRVNQDYNKTESIFTYKHPNELGDSTVEIHGTDDENTVHGLTQSVAWFNEPYKISREVFDQVDQRTEDFIIIDYNPKQGHWVEDIIKDARTIVIDSTFKDNPFCPTESRNKILSYQPVSMCRLVIDGTMTENEARQYDVIANPASYSDRNITELVRCKENEHKNSANKFNWEVYGLGLKSEQPNRILSCIEIALSVYDAIDAITYTGCDWGAVDPWGILDVKYYDGGLYVRERNYSSENELRGKLTATELTQVAGSDEGIVSWMFKRLGIPSDRTIICDNNRLAKIHALVIAGWDYSYPANKPAGSIIDGIDLLSNLRIYYTSDSLNFKYEQENYSRKIDRYGVVLEEPEDCNNHLIDPLRYVALFLQIMGVINKV